MTASPIKSKGISNSFIYFFFTCTLSNSISVFFGGYGFRGCYNENLNEMLCPFLIFLRGGALVGGNSELMCWQHIQDLESLLNSKVSTKVCMSLLSSFAILILIAHW